jgi:hypothetical protein
MRYLSVIFPLPLILLLQCTKDSNPVSYVDSYKVTLLEPEGTVHAGDHYPLAEGIRWTYTGYMDISLLQYQAISDGIVSTADTTDTSFIAQIVAVFTALAPVQVQLSDGPHTLYPIETQVTETSESVPQTIIDTLQYLEKTAEGVFQRASRIPGEGIIEINGELLMKNTLIVGDEWDINPSFSFIPGATAESSGNDINLATTGKGKAFVCGAEAITIAGVVRRAVRVEMVNDAAFSGSSDSMEMKETGSTRGISIYHVVSDTGIVRNQMKANTHLNITIRSGTTLYVSDAKAVYNDALLELTEFNRSGGLTKQSGVWLRPGFAVPAMENVLRLHGRLLLSRALIFQCRDHHLN